jgi:hypothetical protein
MNFSSEALCPKKSAPRMTLHMGTAAAFKGIKTANCTPEAIIRAKRYIAEKRAARQRSVGSGLVNALVIGSNVSAAICSTTVAMNVRMAVGVISEVR